VVDVDAQDVLELSAACDQEPVEAVAADRSDPVLGERVRVRRPERGADDLDALGSKHLVEDAAEVAVAVVDQEAGRCRSSGEWPGELPGLLSCPAAIRIRWAAGHVHAPRAELNEEQHVQTSEPERLNGKKSQASIDAACARRNLCQLS
jgi:hypothetical protein